MFTFIYYHDPNIDCQHIYIVWSCTRLLLLEIFNIICILRFIIVHFQKKYGLSFMERIVNLFITIQLADYMVTSKSRQHE